MLAAACGGGAPAAPSSPASPSPGPGGLTITITSSGVSPRELTVPPGARVMFVNNDSRSHEMTSDPHPDHTDCPEINQAGFLNPGQRRETGNLVTSGICGFHDHLNDQDVRLQGRIVIQ